MNAAAWTAGMLVAIGSLTASSRPDAMPLAPPRLDLYGGVVAAPAVATGFFHLEQRAGRWMLISPVGNPFWMRAVYGVDWNDGGAAAREALQRKYHGDPQLFARHANLRLRQWGFNTLGNYSSAYALPLPTYYRAAGNPEKLPFLRDLNLAWYGAINEGSLAPAPFKTLLAGAVDPAVYRGWPGHVPDVFDPNFALYAQRAAADLATVRRQTIFTERTSTGGAPQPSLVDNPWLLATVADDSDDLFGFGPGPDLPGQGGVVQPHIGWIVAVTRPEQERNTEVGAAAGLRRTVTYADPKVYAKAAWVDFLRRRYHTIAALNAAWGAGYTTFESDGGWPRGRGVLDESGRNRWIGDDPLRLSGAAPGVRRDLDDFLALYADTYYRIVTAAIRAATPHQLVFSGVLDSSGGMSRPEVLAAAGRYCDALQVVLDPARPQLLADTWASARRPVFAWLGLRADADSPLGGAAGMTQAERGQAYAKAVAWMVHARVGVIAPVIGLEWWEYMDKPAEHANWGLVTPADNAYDGRQDTPRLGLDPWGIPVGGESAAYGDFLDAVTAANRAADFALAPRGEKP